jgi:hypothetical protein
MTAHTQFLRACKRSDQAEARVDAMKHHPPGLALPLGEPGDRAERTTPVAGVEVKILYETCTVPRSPGYRETPRDRPRVRVVGRARGRQGRLHLRL